MALRACNVSNCFSEVMKWDEAWDLKSVWEKVIPLTVLSFSFAEFLFTLVTVMLLTSSPTSVVFLQNFHWGVCCCLLSFLYLAGFLPFSNHFSSSRTTLSFTLRVCVRFFPLTMYAVQGDIQLWCFFGLVWWLLADRLEKLYIYARFIFSGVTHGGFKTPGRCYLLCRAAVVVHYIVHIVFQCGYRLLGHSLIDL